MSSYGPSFGFDDEEDLEIASASAYPPGTIRWLREKIVAPEHLIAQAPAKLLVQFREHFPYLGLPI
jgi:hypothetical protein